MIPKSIFKFSYLSIDGTQIGNKASATESTQVKKNLINNHIFNLILYYIKTSILFNK